MDNALAPVLVDAIRDLRAARVEHERLTALLVRAETAARWWQHYAAATQDFNHWLMKQTRQPVVGLVRDWHAELDRRAVGRERVA